MKKDSVVPRAKRPTISHLRKVVEGLEIALNKEQEDRRMAEERVGDLHREQERLRSELGTILARNKDLGDTSTRLQQRIDELWNRANRCGELNDLFAFILSNADISLTGVVKMLQEAAKEMEVDISKIAGEIEEAMEAASEILTTRAVQGLKKKEEITSGGPTEFSTPEQLLDALRHHQVNAPLDQLDQLARSYGLKLVLLPEKMPNVG